MQQLESQLTQALKPALYPLAEQWIAQNHKGPSITGKTLRFIAPEADGLIRVMVAVTTAEHDYLYHLRYR